MSGGASVGRSAGVPAPSPSPADVGIVAALSVEMGFILDRLTRVREYAGPCQTVIEGEHEGKVVALVIGGPGRAAARRAGERLIDGHRPRWVVSAGFGAHLEPELHRNDVVLVDTVIDPEGRRFTVDVPEPVRLPRTRAGLLATVDALVRTAADKSALRAVTGASVVDMETSAVAELCRERGTRFLSIRVVSDEARDELPREVAELMYKSGSYLVGAALRALWNRPSSLKDFMTLHQVANEAADRLADVTLAAVARLPD